MHATRPIPPSHVQKGLSSRQCLHCSDTTLHMEIFLFHLNETVIKNTTLPSNLDGKKWPRQDFL